MTTGATVRTQHDECGDVFIHAHKITAICVVGQDDGRYTFICPYCDQSVTKNAGEKIMQILVKSGAKVLNTTFHPEYPDATKPTLTRKDLYDFMLKIKSL